MKPLQALNDTADRLVDQVRVVRRRLHTKGWGILKSLEREHAVASGLKIEIIRDVCEQAAILPDQLNQESFPLFKEFPTEIRLLIWHFASTAGRVVELQWSKQEIGFRNYTAPRPPAVLHTCRDSRKEALKVFRPYFSMKGRRKPIYIDPINDILFFRVPPGFYEWQWSHDWMYMPNRPQRVGLLLEELKGIRRVAFLWRDIEHDAIRLSLDPLRMLPELEELIILWADWSVRTFEGRGVNFIEGVSSCVHHMNTKNLLRSLETVRRWEVQLGWENLGSKSPAFSYRHWCLRDEEKENVL
jgi:2EXR family